MSCCSGKTSCDAHLNLLPISSDVPAKHQQVPLGACEKFSQWRWVLHLWSHIQDTTSQAPATPNAETSKTRSLKTARWNGWKRVLRSSGACVLSYQTVRALLSTEPRNHDCTGVCPDDLFRQITTPTDAARGPGR